MNDPEYSNSLDESSSPSERIPSLRYRALINAIVTPLTLAIYAGLGFAIWHLSLKWATTSNVKEKLLWGGTSFALIGIGIILTFLTVGFMRWVSTGQSIRIWKNIKTWLPQYLPPKLPFRERLKTLLLVIPAFLALDASILALAITWAISVTIVVSAFDGITILAIGVDAVILTLVSGYIVYLHISYIHWIVTGNAITSMKDIIDWSLNT